MSSESKEILDDGPHPPAVRRHRNEGERREIQMKLITGLTLMLVAVLAPLSAYADRTDGVQAPHWDRPDPPSQPVPYGR
jgi:hypothetical protein